LTGSFSSVGTKKLRLAGDPTSRLIFCFYNNSLVISPIWVSQTPPPCIVVQIEIHCFCFVDTMKRGFAERCKAQSVICFTSCYQSGAKNLFVESGSPVAEVGFFAQSLHFSSKPLAQAQSPGHALVLLGKMGKPGRPDARETWLRKNKHHLPALHEHFRTRVGMAIA
jgi:hypothetical protein